MKLSSPAQNTAPFYRRLSPLVAVGITVMFALYTAIWCWGLHSLHRDLNALWMDAPRQNLFLSNPPPRTTGYPGKYKINWSGLIQSTDGEMTIPDLQISFLPIPKTSMVINMTKGFRFSGRNLDLPPNMPALIFEKFYAVLEIPTHLPLAWTRPEVQKISAAKTIYRLHNFHGKGPVLPNFTPEWQGSGTMDFDENLQPRGTIQMEFQNPEQIRDILATAIRSPLGQSFAVGAINSMIKTDTATGKTTLPITFKLQNGKVYAGPLQVGYFGTIYWPVVTTDSPAPAFPPSERVPASP